MEGKIVCVTGASSGIGAHICVDLAKGGATVIGLARRAEKINELNIKLDGKGMGKIIGLKCDVENQSEIYEAFAFIRKEYAKLDVFINNAGILQSGLITEDDPENIRKLFEVNVIAACICIKEAVKIMKETTCKGYIVIMNSILGHRIPDLPPITKPPFGLYPASKYALTALTQSLKHEMTFLKLPIKITSISPGLVKTDILSEFDPLLIAMQPKLKVDDITEAVKYVLNTPDHVRVDEIIITPMV